MSDILGRLAAKGSGSRTYLVGGTLIAAGIAVLAGLLDLDEKQIAGIASLGTGLVSVTLRLAVAKLGAPAEVADAAAKALGAGAGDKPAEPEAGAR